MSTRVIESRAGVRTRLACALVLGAVGMGCAAVYPEIASPIRAPAPGRELEPAPPEDLLFIAFEKASIPAQTRDGRQWDRVGGGAPDSFAQLFVDDEEIIKTPIQSNTLEPTWPDQKRANYRIRPGAKVRVELWDKNPISNQPICRKNLRNLHARADMGSVSITCDSGARMTLRVESAHPRVGLGIYYELRSGGAVITRVLKESPAARAGLRKGDRITAVQGKRVEEMEDGELQSTINSNSQLGVQLAVVGNDDQEKVVQVKEGPIYPVVGEGIPLG